MTSVYIDRRLLSVRGGDEDPHTPPGVPEALSHLAEAGLEVVVVDGVPPADPGVDDGRRVAPDGAASGGDRRDGWFLTPDRSACSIARRQGLRTMLVGPHLEAHRPTERCDEESRDLGAAALGILAADAMGRP